MRHEKIFREFLPRSLLGAFPAAMPALTHPKINSSLAALIPAAENELLMKLPNASADAKNCLRAGLWLLADDLDTAHKLCQDVPASLGSAWHAHLHRREGDFWNSNYWWRRASGLRWKLPDGDLAGAVRETLAPCENPDARHWAGKLQGGVYDPMELVVAAEKSGDDAWLQTLREIQRLEWLSLFYASLDAAR